MQPELEKEIHKAIEKYISELQVPGQMFFQAHWPAIYDRRTAREAISSFILYLQRKI